MYSCNNTTIVIIVDKRLISPRVLHSTSGEANKRHSSTGFLDYIISPEYHNKSTMNFIAHHRVVSWFHRNSTILLPWEHLKQGDNRNSALPQRELLRTDCNERVLEYGVRAPVFYRKLYRSKREKTVFHEYLQESCFVLAEISESLRKPPGVYGRM